MKSTLLSGGGYDAYFILFYGICLIAMVVILCNLIGHYDSERKKCYNLISKILFSVSILLISILLIDYLCNI